MSTYNVLIVSHISGFFISVSLNCITLFFTFCLLFGCSDDEVFKEKPVLNQPTSSARIGQSPQFINHSFQDSIPPWIEFSDLGYPTSPFILEGDRVTHESNDTSTVLLQDNFPPGYYRVGITATGDNTSVVMYQRKTKRLLVELDRYTFRDSALVAYEFFLTDSVSTIGFQAKGRAVVYDVQVYQYIGL